MARWAAIGLMALAIVIGLGSGMFLGHYYTGAGVRPVQAMKVAPEQGLSLSFRSPAADAPLWARRAARSRPVDGPLLAVVLYGVDDDPASHMAALRLPRPITIGFSPRMPGVQARADAARRAGHEILLTLPDDPADTARLDARQRLPENRRRLHWMMGQVEGAMGIMDLAPGRSPSLMALLSAEAGGRGMVLVSRDADIAGVESLPGVVPTRRIGPHDPPQRIGEVFESARARARAWGKAVVLAPANPVVLRTLRQWSGPVALVPLSAVIRRDQAP